MRYHLMPMTTLSAPTIAALAAMCLGIAVSVTATAARAQDLIVRYDQSQLLRLPRPPAEVIVGNSSIADVSVIGGNMLVITGKTYGVTNIISIDAEGQIIQDQRIQVERDHHNVVHLHRGANRQSYSCVPSCSPMLSIGDDNTFFEQVAGQNKTKTGFSAGQVKDTSPQ